MNENTPTPELPELSDAAVTRIESAVFAQVEDEPRPLAAVPVRARSRRRRWLTGLGVAAAFVAGVLVTPPLLLAAGGSATSTAGGEIPGTTLYDAGSADRSLPGDVTTESESLSASASDQASTGVADESVREIVASAYASLEVDDIADAVAAITALAADKGGYVEGTEIGKSGAGYDVSMPTPVDGGYGWISIRVPSAELPAVVDALGGTGEVLSSSTSKQDVTAAAIDLRARVDAARASVQRLTELMAQSGSVSELIEAEVALTSRQAELESYEQQLASIEDQVAMSTLQVQLTLPMEQASADPAGFGDGLLAGWNGLIVSLNALVIAIGFILPWLGVAAVIVLVFWLVRRARRTRRVTVPATADDDS